MALARDTFCSFCGVRYVDDAGYPRTCSGCQTTIWANPIPVSVVLAPVVDGDRTGLLVVRRAIQPQLGKLGIVGGFLEEHESWQVGGAREVREETDAIVDPATLTPVWFASSEPRPNRVLLFSTAPPQPVTALPPFAPNTESSERGLVFGPGGLADVFAFSLHVAAAERFFAAHGITGPHDFVAR